MRRANKDRGIVLCLILNLVLNIEGIVPAVILFALHFWLGISIWWAVAALALWILGILARTLLISWGSHCAAVRDPQKPNKNPYSVGNEKYRQSIEKIENDRK